VGYQVLAEALFPLDKQLPSLGFHEEHTEMSRQSPNGTYWKKRALKAEEKLARQEAEVRLNDDKTLDEVVTKDGDQLEQMDFNHWFLQIGDVAVWLWAKGKITATYERRPSLRCEQSDGA
jgi:hypothetical protein